jgi:hypothetical protein
MAVLPFAQKVYRADFRLTFFLSGEEINGLEGDFSRRDCVHVIARNGMSCQPM